MKIFTIVSTFAIAVLFACHAAGQTAPNIFQAILMDADRSSSEVSTEELRRILNDRLAIVLDARPFQEFAVSHIPGAVNVAAKPGVAISIYVSDVAEINRVVKGQKDAPIVLYCNGPFCGKSKRLADELVQGGFTNVRRYQLGIPVWRALGGVTQIELEGVDYVLRNDRTAVVVDAREASEFKANGLKDARNIPQILLKPGKDVGEIRAAKDDGRLPMLDHNTRIIVYGKNGQQAFAVAQAISNEAFHNVSYFNGSVVELERVRQE